MARGGGDGMKVLSPVLNLGKSANVTAGSGVPAAEEVMMRTIPFILMTFVALSLSASPSAAAPRTGANGTWCANYGTGHSGIDCSFTSFEQCRATVAGVYGFCQANPYPGTGYGRGGNWNLAPAGKARGYRAER
jgi:Protein of unknown function (DUF3551)